MTFTVELRRDLKARFPSARAWRVKYYYEPGRSLRNRRCMRLILDVAYLGGPDSGEVEQYCRSLDCADVYRVDSHSPALDRLPLTG